jgi:hypothetical protein
MKLRSERNIMINRAVDKNDHIARLQATIQQLHQCGAVHCETVAVREEFRPNVFWQGEVEIFEVTGLPHPKRCYGWYFGQPEQFIVLVDLPSVRDANSAVKVGMNAGKFIPCGSQTGQRKGNVNNRTQAGLENFKVAQSVY